MYNKIILCAVVTLMMQGHAQAQSLDLGNLLGNLTSKPAATPAPSGSTVTTSTLPGSSTTITSDEEDDEEDDKAAAITGLISGVASMIGAANDPNLDKSQKNAAMISAMTGAATTLIGKNKKGSAKIEADNKKLIADNSTLRKSCNSTVASGIKVAGGGTMTLTEYNKQLKAENTALKSKCTTSSSTTSSSSLNNMLGLGTSAAKPATTTTPSSAPAGLPKLTVPSTTTSTPAKPATPTPTPTPTPAVKPATTTALPSAIIAPAGKEADLFDDPDFKDLLGLKAPDVGSLLGKK